MLYGTGSGVSVVKNQEYKGDDEDATSTSSKTSVASAKTAPAPKGGTKVAASIAGSALTPAVTTG